MNYMKYSANANVLGYPVRIIKFPYLNNSIYSIMTELDFGAS